MFKQSCRAVIVLLFFTTLCRAQIADTNAIKRNAFIKSQTVKSDTLNMEALKLAVPGASMADLNLAIDKIMSGLHTYSKFRDSTGLRETFDHLALVYHLQKKYTQAKWFFIQSNTLSRQRNDTLNIISSLLNLVSVKDDIKDFSMARRDLNEALALAKTRHTVDAQVDVQQAFSQYYLKQGNKAASIKALNQIAYLKDSVLKRHTAKPALAAGKGDSVNIDSLQPGTVSLKETQVQQTSWFITIVTLVTAALAAICVLLYFRGRKRK